MQLSPTFLLCLTYVSSHRRTGVIAAADPSVYIEPSTCASTTINYITQTLPQQCLRTGWRSRAAHAADQHVIILGSGQNSSASQEVLPTSHHDSEGSTSQPARTSSDVSSTTTLSQEPTSTSSQASEEPAAEIDIDPLSDKSNFLSFEEWKAQMLKKAGQSPEDIGKTRGDGPRPDSRRRLDGINNALDSLGDEGEIELDFSGFVSPESAAEASPSSKVKGSGTDGAEGQQDDKAVKRSKEAGTTSKERFNYASFDCAATVLKTNSKCKGATSTLLENKDSYMLNACNVKNKFLIVELCSDILIDTIALGNFEFFSSTFRTFRVSISDRYPVRMDKWREIGTYEARNTRGVQAFLVENGLIWARYLRIEFLTHYGNEHYCPVSLLRVHGKTMMDDYRNEVKATRGEEEVDEESLIADDDHENERPADVVVAEAIQKEEAAARNRSMSVVEDSTNISGYEQMQTFNDTCPRTSYLTPLLQQVELLGSSCHIDVKFCNVEHVKLIKHTTRESLRKSSRKSNGKNSVTAFEEAVRAMMDSKPVVHPQASIDSPEPMKHSKNIISANSNEVPSSDDTRKTQPKIPSTVSKVEHKSTTNPQPSKAQNDQHANPPSKASTQPPLPAPSTQESFFKSIHKRLSLLEANSTLSLQYIEEQSRILREAFVKVEKRQLSKTTTFLENLNVTVLNELREFRLQYDQIWQSTVLELSSQREQSQREVLALTSRLTLLADEMIWQKRIVYLQFILIVLCLGLVLFSRSPAGQTAYLELPRFQSMVGTKSGSLGRYLQMESPPQSRPGSRYGLFSRSSTHLRSPSHDTTLTEEGPKSPSIDYQPPTPPPDFPEGRMESLSSSPEADMTLRRAVSSPILGENLRQSEDGLDDTQEPPESERSVSPTVLKSPNRRRRKKKPASIRSDRSSASGTYLDRDADDLFDIDCP